MSEHPIFDILYRQIRNHWKQTGQRPNKIAVSVEQYDELRNSLRPELMYFMAPDIQKPATDLFMGIPIEVVEVL